MISQVISAVLAFDLLLSVQRKSLELPLPQRMSRLRKGGFTSSENLGKDRAFQGLTSKPLA
jgi:hypothetical protein